MDDAFAFRAELVKVDRPSAAQLDRRRPVDQERSVEMDPPAAFEANSIQEQPAQVSDTDAAEPSGEKCRSQRPVALKTETESPKTDAAAPPKTDAAMPLVAPVENPVVAVAPTPIVPQLIVPELLAPDAPSIPSAGLATPAGSPDALTQPAPVVVPVAPGKETRAAIGSAIDSAIDLIAIKQAALPQPALTTASNPAPAISLDSNVTLTAAPEGTLSAPTPLATTQGVGADQVAPVLLSSVLPSPVAPRLPGNAGMPAPLPAASDESTDAPAAIAKAATVNPSPAGAASTFASRAEVGGNAAPAQSAFVLPQANAGHSATPAPATTAPETVFAGVFTAPGEAATAQAPSAAVGALAAHSSVTPPPTAIQVQVGAPRLTVPAEALAYEIKRHHSNGVNRFEIRLEPAELGRIDVRLEVADDGTTRAHLSADRPETLDLLQRDSRALERALQGLGLKTDRDAIAFSLRQDGAAEGGDNRSGRDSERRAASGTGSLAPFEEEMPAALAAAVGRYDSMRINIVI
jgi:hypothetical protein